MLSRNEPDCPSADTTDAGRLTCDHADPSQDSTTGRLVFPSLEIAGPTAHACAGPDVVTPNSAVCAKTDTVFTVRQPNVPVV